MNPIEIVEAFGRGLAQGFTQQKAAEPIAPPPVVAKKPKRKKTRRAPIAVDRPEQLPLVPTGGPYDLAAQTVTADELQAMEDAFAAKETASGLTHEALREKLRIFREQGGIREGYYDPDKTENLTGNIIG